MLLARCFLLHIHRWNSHDLSLELPKFWSLQPQQIARKLKSLANIIWSILENYILLICSVYLDVYFYTKICMSLCLPAWVAGCLSGCLSVLSVLSVLPVLSALSVCVSVCLSLSVSLCLSLSLSLSVCLSLSASLCLSLSLSVGR